MVMGYYLPFCVIGTILCAIAQGLLSMLSPSTSTGEWIGYQIILGVGRGVMMQMPFVAVQNTLPDSIVSVSTSLLTFMQTLGGAVMLSLGEVVFSNSLTTSLLKYAPGVNPEVIVEAGATGIRTVITDPTELAEVLVAYSKSVDSNFYFAVGCAGVCFFLAWGMGWKDIRKKPKAKRPTPEEQV